MQEAQLRCAHERHQGDSEAVRSRESEEDLVKLLNTIYDYPYYYRGDDAPAVVECAGPVLQPGGLRRGQRPVPDGPLEIYSLQRRPALVADPCRA